MKDYPNSRQPMSEAERKFWPKILEKWFNITYLTRKETFFLSSILTFLLMLFLICLGVAWVNMKYLGWI